MFGFASFAEVAFADFKTAIIPSVYRANTGGLTKKTKSKVYKDLRQEVEDDIAKAIAKVTGEDKAEKIALIPESKDNSLEAEIKAAEEAKLQEMVLEAQALALQAEIDRLIQDELDDEESLMLLL